MRTIFLSLLLITFIALTSPGSLSGEIRLLERLEVDPSQSQLFFPRDFCLTEDGLFLISDQYAREVKIYQLEGKTLKLVGTIGGANATEGRLQYPTYCFYNPEQSRFGVIDFDKKAILLYDRLNRLDFKYDQAIDCPHLADGIQLIGNTLWVSGYTPDTRNNPYDLYAIDLSSYRKTFLMPSYLKYGLKSLAEYEEKYMNSLDIRALGISGWFSVQGDYVYFAWEGDLRIIKMDRQTGRLQPFSGITRTSSRYVRPYFSEQMRNGYRNRDAQVILKEKDKMAFVKHLFTDSGHVYVVYQGPVTQNPRFRVQIYTLNGDRVDDTAIPDKPGDPMWLDKETGFLYSIGQKPGGNGFVILRYDIR